MVSLIPSPEHITVFEPVAADEMSFALSVFVNAANRKLLPASPEDVGFDQGAKDACERLYQALCVGNNPEPTNHPKRASEATLYQAVLVLYEQYEGHPQQVSLCARVLAFHFLMMRSAGAVLAGWAQAHPQSPEYVLLPPPVVYAIANVQLDQKLFLKDSSFLELVEKMATEYAEGP